MTTAHTATAKQQDAPMLSRMRKIGLVAGQDFDASKLGASDKESMMAVPKLALMKMAERLKSQQPVHGWLIFGSNVGDWGTDYLLRGTMAMLGPGWNLPADAVYPLSQEDANGND